MSLATVDTNGEDPAAHSHWCTFTDLYHASVTQAPSVICAREQGDVSHFQTAPQTFSLLATFAGQKATSYECGVRGIGGPVNHKS